jgi:hypothetical protein
MKIKRKTNKTEIQTKNNKTNNQMEKLIGSGGDPPITLVIVIKRQSKADLSEIKASLVYTVSFLTAKSKHTETQIKLTKQANKQTKKERNKGNKEIKIV